MPAARVSSRSAAKASRTCSTSLGFGGGFAGGQVGAGGAVGGVDAVGAGGGQPGEHLPGGGLLGGGERVVGALGAGGDGAFDAAGALVVGEGDRVPGPVPPGLVQGVGQQRQRPGAGGPGLAVGDLGQQHGDQVVVDLRAGFLGRLGDRHPQLPPGHRGDQVPVLDRAGQLRVVGAAGLEVGAHAQHDQGRRCLAWTVAVVAAACRAVMNARRCPSWSHWVNSSSNWSTTSTTAAAADHPRASSAAAGPRAGLGRPGGR